MSGCFDVFDTLIFINTDTVVDIISYGIFVLAYCLDPTLD